MNINYTNYCNKNLTIEKNKEKVAEMLKLLKAALEQTDIHGKITATCYTDGNIKVDLNGTYYKMFDTITNSFFAGYVGDHKQI